MGGRVVDRYTKIKEQKRFSKTIDIVSYAVEVTVKWCHMCVCSPFQT